jgi:hypothetical protein
MGIPKQIINKILSGKERDNYELQMILNGKGLDIENCPNCGFRKCMCDRGE